MESNILAIMISISSLLLVPLSVETLQVASDQKSKLSAQSIAAITLSDIKASPKVEKICGKTENPRLCEKTVSTRGVDGKGPISAKTILLEQVQACVDEAELAKKDCSAAVADIGDKDKVLAGCYGTCNDLYGKATGDLTLSVNECNIGNMDQTAKLADNAMSYFESCDDSFEQALVTSPLKETNDFLRRLANNAICIARAIKEAGLTKKKK